MKSVSSRRMSTSMSTSSSNSNPNVKQWAATPSWTRLALVFLVTTLVGINIFHLNARYLTQIYIQDLVVAVELVDPSSSQEDARPVQVSDDFPPVYWINLDRSTDRRDYMSKMFSRHGINDHYRVSAVDVEQTKSLLEEGNRVIFHPNVSMDEKDGKPSYVKHAINIYEYPEAACLLSHLKTIHLAYKNNHDQVLVLEDDALLSPGFLTRLTSYMQEAPSDWRILQFATNNKNVVKQGIHLLDPFVTWQPYHWSTRAYLINREGMAVIVNKTHSLSPAGLDVWTVDEVPVVVADEVLYYVTGGAYTSTGLWVDAANFGSTIQSRNAHSNLEDLVGSGSGRHTISAKMLQKSVDKSLHSKSVLVLMSVRIDTMDDLNTELRWIQLDNEVLMAAHESCQWEVNVVLTDNSLMAPFNATSMSLPSNIHFQVRVSPEPFNKFAYLRDLVGEMPKYDLVVFKDNDQRIAGLPWKTIVHRMGNATVAGPLRQSVEEAMLYRGNFPKRQWFRIHSAESWTKDWKTSWGSDVFGGVVPIEVPMLEMYFVIMNGDFAGWFFDQVLTDTFVGQKSAWGPDIMWCGAAKDWNPSAPSCYLVPVVSTHEDTQQIMKNSTTHKSGGLTMIETFRENPTFAGWMDTAQSWKDLIGGAFLWQVEQNCRSVLKKTRTRLQNKNQLLLQSCADTVATGMKKKKRHVLSTVASMLGLR
eukprot:Nitzschia sp. Nitz4//scaffold210_size37948//3826//5925//NITZ4_007686-RA/size37948-processed-gene-0.46-mRNA-1//-1//CDS//3329541918//5377//frame0